MGIPFSSPHVTVSDPMWPDTTITFDVLISNIPLESRINFTIFGVNKTALSEESVVVGWVNLSLFTEERLLITGTQTLGMWLSTSVDPSGIASSDSDCGTLVLFVDFPEYPLPVQHQFTPEYIYGNENLNLTRRVFPSAGVQRELERLVESSDPLTPLSPTQKEQIWEHRDAFIGNPKALAVVLQSADWFSPSGPSLSVSLSLSFALSLSPSLSLL
jgi:hypothetical protein